jgi:hypothetical protein
MAKGKIIFDGVVGIKTPKGVCNLNGHFPIGRSTFVKPQKPADPDDVGI